MTDLVIRPAHSRDVSAITEIYARAVAGGVATFELEAPDSGEMAARMNGLVENGFPYLVAESGGDVVGYAYAALYRTRAAYRFTVEDSVYIAEGWHSRGIGRRLLSALIEASEIRGFRQMIAVITDHASAGSIALHRRLGFRHIGTLDAVGWKQDRWLGTVLMQRELGAGAKSPPAV